jgi:hypothetical protein
MDCRVAGLRFRARLGFVAPGSQGKLASTAPIGGIVMTMMAGAKWTGRRGTTVTPPMMTTMMLLSVTTSIIKPRVLSSYTSPFHGSPGKSAMSRDDTT